MVVVCCPWCYQGLRLQPTRFVVTQWGMWGHVCCQMSASALCVCERGSVRHSSGPTMTLHARMCGLRYTSIRLTPASLVCHPSQVRRYWDAQKVRATRSLMAAVNMARQNAVTRAAHTGLGGSTDVVVESFKCVHMQCVVCMSCVCVCVRARVCVCVWLRRGGHWCWHASCPTDARKGWLHGKLHGYTNFAEDWLYKGHAHGDMGMLSP